ncbi:MAG: hypothetical protein EXR78_00635 [Deltaproteobacteria bacterium]|nr:hypothetical protein [Deltaproteobacteria bacterium]
MLKPLSTLEAGLVGYAALHVYAHGNSAISVEARSVRKAAHAVVESVERSQALFGEKSVAISQIATLANECAEAGWDGDEAAPINWMAADTAVQFIRVLPDNVPLPEFAPEPDGSISLDWIQSRHRLFSLSVGSSNRLAYAWLDGSDRGHGVSWFDGERIPPRVVAGILEIMNHGNIAIWS